MALGVGGWSTSCAGKTQYQFWSNANDRAIKVHGRTGRLLEIYLCRHCEHFHVATQEKARHAIPEGAGLPRHKAQTSRAMLASVGV